MANSPATLPIPSIPIVSTFCGVTIMNTCQAHWEDTENNRRVELVVNYQLNASRVEINDVTPPA